MLPMDTAKTILAAARKAWFGFFLKPIFMRYDFTLMIVASLLTACQKQVTPQITTPDISTSLTYTDAEIVVNFTMKNGEIMPATWSVAKNSSHPSYSYDNTIVDYVCYGRFGFGEGDIYAFQVGTNNGNQVLPLDEFACVFNGKDMLVFNTNEVQISIRRK